MKKLFLVFKKDDDGAVTVDWVVLTALMTVLSTSGYLATYDGVESASNKTTAKITSVSVR